MLRGFREKGVVKKTLQRLLNNKKILQGGLGIGIVIMFALSSVLINRAVQAANQVAGNYGYYGGTYGYNSATTSSDNLPAAPSSLSCTTSGACTWTAPTTTAVAGTLIATGGGSVASYQINYGTSSLTDCSGGTSLTSTSASKTLENLTASTTYYVAVCAVDNNGNTGVAATTSLTSAAAGTSTTTSSGGTSSTSNAVGTGTGTTAPTTTTAPTSSSPSVAADFTAEAQSVVTVPATRNIASEATYAARAKSVLGTSNTSIVNFVTYGTASTGSLGAGERLGVLNSYRAAYGRVPANEAQWSDIVKIANGRWPSETSAKAETRAKATFKTIYKHDANMTNANENAAVTVMAYGLRPKNRNLNSEKAAIKNFRGTFGRAPSLATDWDMVRAIAYSGAKR